MIFKNKHYIPLPGTKSGREGGIYEPLHAVTI